MAHFAQIENNVVVEVIVINDEDCNGGVFPESEPIRRTFIDSIGLTGEWLQTSYNNDFRGEYAGIGFSYDPELDIFIRPVIDEEPAND